MVTDITVDAVTAVTVLSPRCSSGAAEASEGRSESTATKAWIWSYSAKIGAFSGTFPASVVMTKESTVPPLAVVPVVVSLNSASVLCCNCTLAVEEAVHLLLSSASDVGAVETPVLGEGFISKVPSFLIFKTVPVSVSRRMGIANAEVALVVVSERKRRYL